MRFPTRAECVLADLLERRAEATPDKVFLVFADRGWTYRESAERAWRFANGLIREGVGEDFVAVGGDTRDAVAVSVCRSGTRHYKND